MALTDASLGAAIHADLAAAARLRPVVVAVVQRHAPEAPEAVKDEAAIRLAGYLLDAPPAPAGSTHAAALRNSGTEDLLSAWRVRRAGVIGSEQPAATRPDFANPPVMRFAFTSAADGAFTDSGFRWLGTVNGVEMNSAPALDSAFGFWIPGSVSRRVTAFEAVEFTMPPGVNLPRLSDFVHGPDPYTFGGTLGLLRYTDRPHGLSFATPNTFRVVLADA